MPPFFYRISMWTLRLFIGGIFLASALGKSLDLTGFVDVLSTYRTFPEAALGPIGVGITLMEWVLAAWVLSAWRLRLSALATVAVNGLYAVWMTVSLLRGLDVPNCGCFGVFFPQPLRWYSTLEDLVLVGMGVTLAALARRGPEGGWTHPSGGSRIGARRDALRTEHRQPAGRFNDNLKV
jgi:hypothetical protein